MELSTEFECGSGKLIREGENRWRLETVADAFGYDKYFCVRIAFSEAEATSRLELDIFPDAALSGRSHFATHFPSHLWYSEREWARWCPVRHTWEDAVKFHDGHIEIRIPVVPGKTLHLATNVPLRYSDLMAWVAKMKERGAGRLRLESLGQSVEGREIPVLRLGEPGKPRMLVLAGQHSSEHSGPWACEGIVQYLLSSIGEAARVLGSFDLAIVPMLNPDGNVRGYSGGNAQRLSMNNSADFEGAADGRQPLTHENALLWKWLGSFRPEAILHFHGYMGWKKFADYPYDGIWAVPQLERFVQDPRRLARQRDIVDRLLFETPAFSAHWDHVGELLPSFLDYELARAYGTLGVTYEINTGSVGPSEQFRRGPQVLSAMARAWIGDAIR